MLTTGAYSHDRMTLDLREGPVTLTVRAEPAAGPIPGRLFGNFLEHLGFATQGGILAQVLDNPTLTIDDHLRPETRRRLLQNCLLYTSRRGDDARGEVDRAHDAHLGGAHPAGLEKNRQIP